MRIRKYLGVGLPHGFSRFNWRRIGVRLAGLDYPAHVESVSGQTLEEITAYSGHKDLSDQMEKEFRAGNVNAIFEYAEQDRLALLAPWVIDQLIEWRQMDTVETRRLFERFMTAYWGKQGKRSARTILEAIERDLKVYAWIHEEKARTQKPIKVLQGEAARQFGMSITNVRKAWQHYEILRKKEKPQPPLGVPQFCTNLGMDFDNLRGRITPPRFS